MIGDEDLMVNGVTGDVILVDNSRLISFISLSQLN